MARIIEAVGGPCERAGARVLHELRETLRLALPLAATQVAQVALLTTDVAMVGRLGEKALAAVSLGFGLIDTLLLFCLGVIMAVAPLVSQAHGARKPRMVRRWVRQGLWLATALAVPLTVALVFAEPILLALRQSPDSAQAAARYVHAVAWGMAPALWFIALRNFVTALGRPRPVLWIMLTGVAVNGILDYALIFGKLGMPTLGAVGAGYATAFVYGWMFLAILGVSVWMRPFRRYAIIRRLWRADWGRFLALLRVGLPIGVTIVFEVGLFTGAVFLMGLIGTTEVAAHQIALQSAAIAFMVPLGLAQAATVRVGHALGRGDLAAVGRAGWGAFALGIAFMALTTLLFVLAPRAITGLYIDTRLPENAAIVALATQLLMVAALFQVFDGTQVIGMGVLRGLSDTRLPMIFAALGYWVFGFGSGVLFGFVLGYGAIGIWFGFVVGLAMVSLMTVGRFMRREAFLPAVV